jgi:subtilase family serine protease
MEGHAIALRGPAGRPAVRRIRLELEELETRALLSASSVAPTTPVPPSEPPSNALAQPLLVMVPQTTNGVTGYTPSQIQQAYGVNQLATVNGKTINGAGETIAIVDAFDDPNIVSDDSAFNKQFNLPQFNQPGGPTLTVVATGGGSPSGLGQDPGWAGEESLDVEWAHAIAPEANILVAETPSQSISDLLAGASYAASQPGVATVSMSWGYTQFAGETNDDSTFSAPGVTFVAAAGDQGALPGSLYPSSSPDVLSVGGTSLYVSTVGSKTNWKNETGWSYYSPFTGGGGYSQYESEPTYQTNAIGSTGARTMPDVSYNANPSTGFIVYDSFGTFSPWQDVGGTSAGSPQWAAIIALADQQRSLQGGTPLDNNQVETTLYNTLSNPTQYANSFHDITQGYNGYYAGKGYDLVTGLGSPKINNVVPLLAGTTVSATSFGVSSPTEGGFSGPTGGGVSGSSGGAGGGVSGATGAVGSGSAAGTHHALLEVSATPDANTTSGVGSSTFTVPMTNSPVSTPASGATSGGTVSSNNNFLTTINLAAQGVQAAPVGGTENLSGSVNTPATQGGTVFGASGYQGSGYWWRLDSYGMHGPTVDALAGELASSQFAEPESPPDSAPSGEDTTVPDLAVPAALDGGGEGAE